MKRVLAGLLSIALLVTMTGCLNKKNTETQPTDATVTSVATSTQAVEQVSVSEELSSDVKAKEMLSLTPLTFEEVATTRAAKSKDATEGLVYRYITDTVTVDTDNLIAVNDSDELKINAVVDEVNTALKTGKSSNGLTEEMLNYMLWEFANTPYAWRYSSATIKGMDAATRQYFVDVTYRTTTDLKEEIPKSVIVHGAPNESNMKAKRYSDYLVYLSTFMGETADPDAWDKLITSERSTADAMSVFAYGDLGYDNVMDGFTEDSEKQTEAEKNRDLVAKYTRDTLATDGTLTSDFSYTFEDRWGSLEQIFATQNDVTMSARLRERQPVTEDDILGKYKSENNIGVYTYPGLTEVAKDYGAALTFRFVIKYAYNIGTDDAMTIQSVYLYDYQLDKQEELKEKYTTASVLNADVLKPFIESTIKSYRKAIEENNHAGLFSLFVTYDKYDVYFEDLSNYAYINNGGFTIDCIGRKGNEVAVLVTQRTKKRARGTNMTLPTYLETSLLKIKLCEDDKVRIISTTLLSSTLIGEPISLIRDVVGVSAQIKYSETNFTQANAVAVEKAIQQFEQMQLEHTGTDFKPSDFDIIDLGMSSTEKSGMLSLISAVENMNTTKSVVWLSGYDTKSNLYVSVRLREVFIGEEGCLDTQATLGLINRDNSWKVISYTRDMSVKTEYNPNMSTANCLVISDLNSTPVSQLVGGTVTSEEIVDTKGTDTMSDNRDSDTWESTQTASSESVTDSVTELVQN